MNVRTNTPHYSLLLALFAWIASGFVFARTTQGETTIVLHPAATLAPGTAVRLADLAQVTGSEAERLREAVIVNDSDAKARDFAKGFGVSLDDVRAGLERLPRGVNWGTITLSGSTCFVRQPLLSASEQPAKEAETAIPGRKVLPRSGEEIRAETTRGVIATRLAALLGVELGDLRIKVSAATKNDEAYLDAPVPTEVRVEVQPSASMTSARVPLRVETYQRDRLVDARSYTAEVQVRVQVVVTTGVVDREQLIGEQDIKTEQRWLLPTSDAPASLGQVIGATPKRRLETGKVITAQDLQPAVVVQRGEAVWVHCLSGQFVVKSKARSLQAGRDGQLVQLQAEGSKKVFMARMSGRGVAVIELQGLPDDDAGLAIYQPEAGTAGGTGNAGVGPKATMPVMASGTETVRGRASLPRKK